MAEPESFLRRGRDDYGLIAASLHVACHGDEYVMDKILDAMRQVAVLADVDEDDEGDVRLENSRGGAFLTEPATVIQKDELKEETRETLPKVPEVPTQVKIEEIDWDTNDYEHQRLKMRCTNCGDIFDCTNWAEEGPDDSNCWYHPGELVEDEDDLAGFPDAQIWDCCETVNDDGDFGQEVPCENTVHNAWDIDAKPTTYAKMMYGESVFEDILLEGRYASYNDQ